MSEDEIRERLKEISSGIYLAKVAVRHVDNPDMIDNALAAIIRDVDNLIDEIKEKG